MDDSRCRRDTHHRVRPDTDLLRTLGGDGQGPGELSWPAGMAIEGDRLIVNDYSNSRLSQWSLDGAHIADVGLALPMMTKLWPSKNGRVIGLRSERAGNFVWPKTVVLISLEAEVLREYASAPLTELEEVKKNIRRYRIEEPFGEPS